MTRKQIFLDFFCVSQTPKSLKILLSHVCQGFSKSHKTWIAYKLYWLHYICAQRKCLNNVCQYPIWYRSNSILAQCHLITTNVLFVRVLWRYFFIELYCGLQRDIFNPSHQIVFSLFWTNVIPFFEMSPNTFLMSFVSIPVAGQTKQLTQLY